MREKMFIFECWKYILIAVFTDIVRETNSSYGTYHWFWNIFHARAMTLTYIELLIKDIQINLICASFRKSIECLKTSSSTKIKDFMPHSKVIRIIMILQRFKIQNLLHPNPIALINCNKALSGRHIQSTSNLYSMTLKKIVCWKLLLPFKSAKISGVVQQYMLKVKLSPIQLSIQMESWTCTSYCGNLGNLLNTVPVAWKRFRIYINLCPIYDLHRINSMTWSKS